jgi:hypothetical protein
MFGPDEDREALSVDVLVENLQQLLFFFDHLQQRLQRRQRQAAGIVEERRGALDVNGSPVGQVGERGRREPHRPGSQRVEQQPFLGDALEDGLARAVQRQDRKTRC